MSTQMLTDMIVSSGLKVNSTGSCDDPEFTRLH